MLERDWRDIIERGEKPIMIAQVAQFCVDYLGAVSDKLYMDPIYARKAHKKHQISPALFNLIWSAVESGIAIPDRPHHVSFYISSDGRWYQVAIKCSQEDHKLYLCTFHRVKARKVINQERSHGRVPEVERAG